jgi:hypothetical protein
MSSNSLAVFGRLRIMKMIPASEPGCRTNESAAGNLIPNPDYPKGKVIDPMESSHIISRIGHSENSSLREQALGHLFLGELLAEMWRRNRWDIEVLKAKVDRESMY